LCLRDDQAFDGIQLSLGQSHQTFPTGSIMFHYPNCSGIYTKGNNMFEFT